MSWEALRIRSSRCSLMTNPRLKPTNDRAKMERMWTADRSLSNL